MAQFTINVQARGDFVHSEPAQAFANIVHGESQQSHPTDLYQKIPFEDLTLNLITYNDYIASNSLERPLPIPNVNELRFVMFELESLKFRLIKGPTESSLDKYNPRFICTKNEMGEYKPLFFNVMYPIEVIKRGLFIHAQRHTPLARAIYGNMVLKYNFGYSNQSSISLTNNPFRLEINYGSLITANMSAGNPIEYNFKQINNIKENGFTDFKLQVFGEYDENGYNVPTYMKAPNGGTATSATNGLLFSVPNLNDSPIVGVRTTSGGMNTSGSPQADYSPVELSDYDPLQVGITKKFIKKGYLLPNFTGLSDTIVVNIDKYVTVMDNQAYDDVIY